MLRKLVKLQYHLRLNLKYLLLRRKYNRDKVFKNIYEDNFWGSEESISGVGSELGYTLELRTALSDVVMKYKIETICDAPCGDFNWMSIFLEQMDHVKYTGCDIVQKLIDINNELHANGRISFRVLDICTDRLPASDLLIIRDVLFHLSNSDLILFLNNLKETNFKYLMISHHEHDRLENKNILTGDFRELHLGLSPLYFPIDKALLEIKDAPEWYPIKRQMLLFTRHDLFAD